MVYYAHNLFLSFINFIAINVIILLDSLHKFRLVDFLVINLFLVSDYAALFVIFHTQVREHLILMLNEISFKSFIHFLDSFTKLLIQYLVVQIIKFFLILHFFWRCVVINKNIKKQMEDFISCKKGGKKKASFFRNNKDGIVKNQCVVSFFNFEDFLSHEIYLRLL